MRTMSGTAGRRAVQGNAKVGCAVFLAAIATLAGVKVYESVRNTSAEQLVVEANSLLGGWDAEGQLEIRTATQELQQALKGNQRGAVPKAKEFLEQRLAQLEKRTTRFTRPHWLVCVDGQYTGTYLTGVEKWETPVWRLTWIEPNGEEIQRERGVTHYHVVAGSAVGPLWNSPRVWEAERQKGLPVGSTPLL
jgi:hypothetical protein